ncbi:MAG: DUF4097 family beta strand repeat-containing protein [Nocardioidaceae bacterium]
MQHTFETPGPTSLYVQIGSGSVGVVAAEVTETVVEIEGRDADAVQVEQRDDQIVVIGPKSSGFFGGGRDLDVHVRMPLDSRFATKVGSADVDTRGRLGETTVKSGSGEVRIEQVDANVLVETGSGDIVVGLVSGALRVKSGSGDVGIDKVEGPISVSTGSGDVQIATAGDVVQTKSGSGDTTIGDAAKDVSVSTASGDLVVDTMHRGELRANNVSGDIRVGVPTGTPVWTDIHSLTGSVRSNLESAGRPAEGEDYIEMRAKTVSGDIYLERR